MSEKIKENVLSEYEIKPSEPVVDTLKAIANECKSITVSDWRNEKEIQWADQARKGLVKTRNNIEKKRKELKQESLEKGRQIDNIAKELIAIIEPVEKRLKSDLEKCEHDKARHYELENNVIMLDARLAELKTLGVEISEQDLLEITQSDYDLTVANAKEAIVAEAQRQREEAERIEAEKQREQETALRIEEAKEQAVIEEQNRARKEAEEKARKQIIDETTGALTDNQIYYAYIQKLLDVPIPAIAEEQRKRINNIRYILENELVPM